MRWDAQLSKAIFEVSAHPKKPRDSILNNDNYIGGIFRRDKVTRKENGYHRTHIMNPDPAIPDRLRASTPGLGFASNEEIERRAVELAMIDGRSTFNDADLKQAAAELTGGVPEPAAPEAGRPEVEDLTTWDEPVEEDGEKVEDVPLEDDANIGEQLVEQGIEEADHDRRVASAEEAADEAE